LFVAGDEVATDEQVEKVSGGGQLTQTEVEDRAVSGESDGF